MSLFRAKQRPVISSRIFLVLIIVVASFLAAFLGQLAMEQISRTPSLLPQTSTIIRQSADAQLRLQQTAADVQSTERASLVQLFDRIDPQAVPAAGLVLTNDGWIVTPMPSGTTAPYRFVRLQSGQIIEVEKTVTDGYSRLTFMKVETTNLRPANLSDRKELETIEPLLGLTFDGRGFISYASGQVLDGAVLLSSDRLNRFEAVDASDNAVVFYDVEGAVAGLRLPEQVGGETAIILADVIRDSLTELLRADKFTTVGLGIQYVDLSTHAVPETLSFGQTSGALITNTYGGAVLPTTSAGARAGLRLNDIIVAIEGTPLTQRESLSDLVPTLRAGEPIVFSVLRRGEPVTLQVTLEELPS